MTCEPRPYLKVTRRASTQRGMRSTSSCSTLTHSTGPMPSGKSNTSGSLNGAVVYQPRSRSHTTGGVRHPPILVPMGKDGGEAEAAARGGAPAPLPRPAVSAERGGAADPGKNAEKAG